MSLPPGSAMPGPTVWQRIAVEVVLIAVGAGAIVANHYGLDLGLGGTLAGGALIGLGVRGLITIVGGSSNAAV